MDRPIATPMFGWMRSKVREERLQSKEEEAKPRRSLLSWLELLLVPPLPPLTGDPERDAEIVELYYRSLSEWWSPVGRRGIVGQGTDQRAYR